MNEKNLLIITVAAAVIVIAAGLMLIDRSDDGEGTEKLDPQGHWYAIISYGFDWNGEYFENDVTTSTVYDIDVFDEQNGLMYGRFLSTSFSGYVDEYQCDFTCKNGNITYQFTGGITDSHIDAIILMTKYDDKGSVISHSAVGCVYSKDFNAIIDHHTFDVNVEGIWKPSYANLYTEDGNIIDLKFDKLTVYDQNKSALKTSGYYLDTKIVNECYIIIMKDGDRYMGLGIDKLNDVWHVEYNPDGYVQICLVTMYNGKCASLDSIFSMDGREITPTEKNLGLEGTQWRSASVGTIDSNGVVNDLSTPQYYFITNEYGSRSCGVITTGLTIVPFATYYIELNGQILFWSISNNDGIISTLRGHMNDQTIYIVNHFEEDDIQKTSISVNNIHTNKSYEDITGHWYMCLISGYDENDEYYSEDIVNTPNIGTCDLDIFIVEYGLLYGYINGEYITGSYTNDIITITRNVDDDRFRMIGWVYDNDTIIMNNVYATDIVGTKSNLSTTFGVYTRDRGSVINPLNTCDILGSWTSISALRYDPPNSISYPPSELHISEYKNNVFKGAMQQYDDDAALYHNINGVLYTFGDGFSAQGMMIDDQGTIWSINVLSDEMRITALFEEIINNPYCLEAIYTRDGKGTSVFTPETDITGTWNDATSYIVSENGDFNAVKDLKYNMTFTDTVNGMSVGTVSYNELFGHVVAVQYSLGNSERIKIGNDFGSTMEYGYGNIIDENTFYIVEKYKDGAGIYYTQITLMKRTS